MSNGFNKKRKPDPRAKARATHDFRKKVEGLGDVELKAFVDIEMKTNTWHFDVPKMLTAFGYKVTEENKDIAVDVLKKVQKKLFPDVPMKVVRGFNHSNN